MLKSWFGFQQIKELSSDTSWSLEWEIVGRIDMNFTLDETWLFFKASEN